MQPGSNPTYLSLESTRQLSEGEASSKSCTSVLYGTFSWIIGCIRFSFARFPVLDRDVTLGPMEMGKPLPAGARQCKTNFFFDPYCKVLYKVHCRATGSSAVQQLQPRTGRVAAIVWKQVSVVC